MNAKIEFSSQVSRDAQDLIISILKIEAKDRPSISSILSHPFVSKCRGKWQTKSTKGHQSIPSGSNHQDAIVFSQAQFKTGATQGLAVKKKSVSNSIYVQNQEVHYRE